VELLAKFLKVSTINNHLSIVEKKKTGEIFAAKIVSYFCLFMVQSNY
jgi:hypothetical protein